MEATILDFAMAKVELLNDLPIHATDEIIFKRLDDSTLTDHKSLLEQASVLSIGDEYLDEQTSVGVLNVNVLADLSHEMRIGEDVFLERWVLNVLSAPRLYEVLSSIIDVSKDIGCVDHVTHDQLLGELEEVLSNIDVEGLSYFYRVLPVDGDFEFEVCAYYNSTKYVLFSGAVSGYEYQSYVELQLLSIIGVVRAFCEQWAANGRVDYADKHFASLRQAYVGILASSPTP